MKQSSNRVNDLAFGERILALRTAIGFSQAEFGKILGLSRHAISAWESGQAYPKAHHLKHLTELLLEQRAFATGYEANEIRGLWRVARQQTLLDEAWLQGLLQKQQASPPLLPVVQPHHVPHNLTKPWTELTGRTAELEAVSNYLGDPGRRLITIVGVGGVGKTRLALEVAWMVLNSQAGRFFRDGVYFVSFADVDIPADDDTNAADTFAAMLADAIRFVLSGSDRPYQQVLRYLRDQNNVLVLDNLEHLPHLTPVLLDLLHQSPSLTILATSIARLDVRGEQVVRLGGLPYQTDAAALQAGETPAALELFQRLASFHAPQLAWSPNEIAAANEICARVEGVPLAIELAASLTRLLSVGEIAAELAASSAVLQTSQRDLAPRHRSLRAVFDHSWRLLSSLEQRVLADLSIFRGGFDRHAAHAVAEAELPAIAALINRSLVREAARDGTTRYTLHALVREYAADRLPAGDDTRIADKHSRYYLDWVAARLPNLRDERQRTAQAEIYRDIDNIRAAWRHAVVRRDIGPLVAAGRALFHFFEMRSWFQEGAELFQLAAMCCEPLAASDEAMTRAWAQLLARQGWLTFHLGKPDTARELLAQSYTLLQPFDTPEDQAFTLNYLAAVTYHAGGYAQAERLAHDALDASQRADDKHGIVSAKTILGQIAYLTGAYEEARRWSLESLALEQTLGNRWGTVFTLISLGRVAVALEAYGDARRWFEEGLAIREQMGDARGVGLCLTYLGDVAVALGEYSEAQQRYEASLLRFRQIRNSAGVTTALTKLSAVALATQDQQHARQLLHESLQVAWNMQALPATLDALAVLANALVNDEPARAAELAALVVRHPAANQTSKRQAAIVWGRLASHYPTPDHDPQNVLSKLMPQLLATSNL